MLGEGVYKVHRAYRVYELWGVGLVRFRKCVGFTVYKGNIGFFGFRGFRIRGFGLKV